MGLVVYVRNIRLLLLHKADSIAGKRRGIPCLHLILTRSSTDSAFTQGNSRFVCVCNPVKRLTLLEMAGASGPENPLAITRPSLAHFALQAATANAESRGRIIVEVKADVIAL